MGVLREMPPGEGGAAKDGWEPTRRVVWLGRFAGSRVRPALGGAVSGTLTIGHGIGEGRGWENAYEQGGDEDFSKVTRGGGVALGEAIGSDQGGQQWTRDGYGWHWR